MKFQFWRHYHDFATIVSAAAVAAIVSVVCGVWGGVRVAGWCLLAFSICGYFSTAAACLFVNNVAVASQSLSLPLSQFAVEVAAAVAALKWATCSLLLLRWPNQLLQSSGCALAQTEASLLPALLSIRQSV